MVKNISISSYSILSNSSNLAYSVWYKYRIFFTQLNAKIVLYETIQFSISTQFKCKYSLIVKNITFSSYSV